MFLPDRFIKAERVPKCGAEDQYGDACEVCSDDVLIQAI